MHHDSKKVNQFVHLLQVLGLLRKKEKKDDDEQYAWAATSRTPTSNVIPVKLKVAINADAPVQHI